MDIEQTIAQMTLEEKASLCSGKGYWHTKSVERLNVPAVMMCDGPIGLRKQQGGYEDNLGINASETTVCFPGTSTLANSFDRKAATLVGKTLGEECQAQDVAMLLGPGMNIKRNVLGGRNFEYYSEDPYVTGELAACYIKALQETGVAACAKHFACNSQETARMSGNSVVEERPLHEIYLAAFEKVVKKAHPRSIMCAYNALNGTFCAENKHLLTDILRHDWGFDGMVVTDWGAVKDRVKGLLAGVDLEMPGGPGAQDEAIVKAVKDGELDEKFLNQAVKNVLRFVDEAVKKHHEAKQDFARDHETAVKLAADSAVLMKNDQQVLPLKRTQKLAFIGDFAKHPRYQGGGSSHVNAYHVDDAWTWAKEHQLNVSFAQGYEQDKVEPDSQLIEEAVSCAKQADAAVIFAGLPESFESEGMDRQTMAMPAGQNELIKAVAAVNPRTVVVLHTGSSIQMPWQDDVAAILNVGLGGEGVGTATGELLFGLVNPSGRLAETYAYKLSDSPSYLNFPGEEGTVHYRENIFVGYRYYDKKEMPVAFPFGYGLSYTTFAYDQLQIEKPSIKDTDTVKVSCRVTNTGQLAGQEVVQLYVGTKQSHVLRPVRELKGFEKVYLQPGQSTVVTFELDQEAFRYYNEQIHNWYVETNDYDLYIGSSSQDLPLTGQVHVQSTVKLPIHYTKFTTIGKAAETPEAKQIIMGVMRQVIHVDDQTYAQMDPQKRQELDQTCSNMVDSAGTMTLMSLVSLGSMKPELLDQLIDRLNALS